jgi:hypothetical protein
MHIAIVDRSAIDGETILTRVIDDAYGAPLIENIWRGAWVEAMIALALPDGWRRTVNSAGWDFEHPDGAKLEVKQSAARQSWPQAAPYRSTFSIVASQYHFAGGKVVVETGRKANIYLFAHHPVWEDADHRSPAQWQFYVVPTGALPNAKSISIERLRKLADPVGIGELADRVTTLVDRTMKVSLPVG